MVLRANFRGLRYNYWIFFCKKALTDLLFNLRKPIFLIQSPIIG